MLGRILGSFRIDALIAQGGLGAVYRARDLASGHEVAVRALKPELAGHAEFCKTLQDFQPRLEGLRHASIVPLVALHAQDQELFLIHEYFDAPSLDRLLGHDGPLPVDAVVLMGQQLLSALAVAHAQGLVHQDLRPSHLLIGLQVARILGFGVSAAYYGNPQLRKNLLPGTAPYLPPERWFGKPYSSAGDIYALGLCLMEALLGRPLAPVEQGARDCFYYHTSTGVPDIREKLPDTPEWLAQALFKATRRKPEDRFPDARSMLQVFRVRRSNEPRPPVESERPPEPAPVEDARTIAIQVPKDEAARRAQIQSWAPPPVAHTPSGPLSRPEPVAAPPPGLQPMQMPQDWKPGEHTMAFVRKTRRRYQWVAGGALAFALLVIGGGALGAWFYLKREPPGLFTISLTNLNESSIRVACSAGESESKRDWALSVKGQRETSISIPALPASCWEVGTDNKLNLLWSSPASASAEGLPLPPETGLPAQEAPLLIPEEAQAKLAVPARPATGAPTGTTQPEPAAVLYVGSSTAEPALTCDDLVALEPIAVKGALSPELIACLEKALGSSEPVTVKDKRSRVLLYNAEARKDMVSWEKLVKRHLSRIDRSDPDICHAYAVYLAKRAGNDDIKESIVYAGFAMESVQRRYSGGEYIKKVSTLHSLRTNSASTMWMRAEKAFQGDRNPKNQLLADEWRKAAKAYAREWYDYALAAGTDVNKARTLCQSVSGTTTLCP